MNVKGGSPLQSSLALQATKGLASQYSTNYGQAANYANVDRSSSQQLLSQVMNGINSSGGYGNPPARSTHGAFPGSRPDR